jgi:hypothetical protein
VGFVDDGSTLSWPTAAMMSGAWPPPAPSVWNVWIVRSLERGQRRFQEPGLVQRVRVQRDLHVHALGHGQAVVDRGRGAAPVLVQLEADGAGLDLLFQRARPADIALAEEAEVHREGVGRHQHRVNMPRARRAGRGRVPTAGPVPPPSMVVMPDMPALPRSAAGR